MVNLIDYDFQKSPLFVTLPEFEAIYFKGFVQEKVQFYKAVRAGSICNVLATSIIRQDERFLWDSSRDLLDRGIKAAIDYVTGVYNYTLLCFDMHRELNTFNDKELSTLLANHSRKIRVGDERLIKYSSSYGLIKKLADENWGQISLHTGVDSFYKQPSQLDLVIKKLLSIPMPDSNHKIIVIHDLSQDPILNENNEEQKQRLCRRFGDQINMFEDAPEVFIYDKFTSTELMSQLRKI